MFVRRTPPRAVHPGAWWVWGLGLMAAATRSTNLVVLAMIVVTCAVVVELRRSDAPWSRTFYVMLKVAAFVIVLRVLLQTLLAPETGVTILFTLPSIELPSWIAGIRLGGFVTAESLITGLREGARLGVVIICVGAAASLASPARLLRSLPAAIYELGVAAVVALTFLPQLITDLQRVRTARRLRGRPTSGVKAVINTASTILDSALDRSITLAASMDSRGYGRRGAAQTMSQRLTDVVMLAGLAGIALGTYGLLDASTSELIASTVLLAGITLSVSGFVIASRRTPRTRYRKDPWQLPEWLISLSGVAVAILFFAAPNTWPAVQPLAILAAVVGAVPAIAAPPVATSTHGVLQ